MHTATEASFHQSVISVNEDEPFLEFPATGTEPESLVIQGVDHNLLTEDAVTVVEDIVVSDSDFSDSDYDIDEGDDDLYDDNIDFDVDEESQEEEDDVEVDDYLLDDEDLNLPIEEAEQLRYKFTAFNSKVDMVAPAFKVGMVFADVKDLRLAITAYSVKNRVQIKKLKNDKTRIEAVCERGCPWWLKAGKDNRTGEFVIKSYYGEHICQKKWKIRKMTA